MSNLNLKEAFSQQHKFNTQVNLNPIVKIQLCKDN